MEKRSCGIHGVGGYLPKKIIPNDALPASLNTTHEWIETRTGICQRHKASDHETTAFMATRAALIALEQGGCGADSIDLIIVATSTPDHAFPPVALAVQEALGAHASIGFDMNVACSGFLFAFAMAESYLNQNNKARALVIGAETMSRLTNPEDRSTAVLFGDGAGAVLLGPCASGKGILDYDLYGKGSEYRALYVENQGENQGYIVMNGRNVYTSAIKHLTESAQAILEKNGLTPGDIHWLVPHQANKRILQAVAKELGIEDNHILYTGNIHANTSAASIPLALWCGYQQGLLHKEQLLLLQAFGAGYTWGSCILRL